MPTTDYCYVDETGQDTTGALFVVGIAVVGAAQAELLRLCEQYERQSGKGRVKWLKAGYEQKLAYLRLVIHTPAFRGRLFYASFHDTRAYEDCTVQAIATFLGRAPAAGRTSVVLIDALPKSKERSTAVKLRQAGAFPKKVRGIEREETHALMRLADSLCGLVRGAYQCQPEMVLLYEQAVALGVLYPLPGC